MKVQHITRKLNRSKIRIEKSKENKKTRFIGFMLKRLPIEVDSIIIGDLVGFQPYSNTISVDLVQDTIRYNQIICIVANYLLLEVPKKYNFYRSQVYDSNIKCKYRLLISVEKYDKIRKKQYVKDKKSDNAKRNKEKEIIKAKNEEKKV